MPASAFQDRVAPADTFVQLVGVAHPSPAKAAQFREVDLVSVRESAAAAVAAGVRHFVYVSVAHPAPVMKVYVLGPGHRWAYALLPMYWVLERTPWTRATALRLGLVTLEEMLRALLRAVEDRPRGVRVVEVPQIRTPGRVV